MWHSINKLSFHSNNLLTVGSRRDYFHRVPRPHDARTDFIRAATRVAERAKCDAPEWRWRSRLAIGEERALCARHQARFDLTDPFSANAESRADRRQAEPRRPKFCDLALTLRKRRLVEGRH